jgi:chromosome segregation ATPase
MQIQSLELRVQTQSRALESRHWDMEAMKEEAAKLQGQLDVNQTCLHAAQEQAMRYLQQQESAQQALRQARAVAH